MTRYLFLYCSFHESLRMEEVERTDFSHLSHSTAVIAEDYDPECAIQNLLLLSLDKLEKRIKKEGKSCSVHLCRSMNWFNVHLFSEETIDPLSVRQFIRYKEFRICN